MMGIFNRNNPIVIHMAKNKDLIQSELLSYTKSYIIFLVVITLLTVINTILFGIVSMKYTSLGYMIILVDIIYYLISRRNFVIVTKMVSIKAIDDIINGDEYKNIYTNNERIFEISDRISILKGTINITSDFMKILSLFVIGLNVISIIEKIITIFTI